MLRKQAAAISRRYMKPSVIWKYLAAVISLAAVYFAVGKLGLALSPSQLGFTTMWPPSGVAVAGLLVLGYRAWPGIFLGALGLGLATPCGLGMALALAAGNTLESLAGAWLANRFAGGRNFYARPWDALKFAALVAIVSPLISPPPGARVLAAEDLVFWRASVPTWLTWWLGEMVSLLVLAPLVVAWAVQPRWLWNRCKTLEFGILLLSLGVTGEAVFGGWAPASAREYLFPYLCLPFLFWAAFRFGQRETITATFVLGAVVMDGALHGYGFFERVSPNHALLVDHGFMVITSVMTMALAAVVDQRRRAGEELEKHREQLEALVQERTGQLGAANTELQQEIGERKQAEAALRENEQRYRSLFSGMTEGFALHEILCDEAGEPCDYRFLEINAAFERLTGLKRENVIGKLMRQVLPTDDPDWIRIFGRVALTGQPAQFEKFSAALERYYQVYAYRTAPRQFAVLFMDVTERKRIEEALRVNLVKYSVLFESFPLGISMTDQQGRILESNRAAAELLGVASQEHARRRIDSTEWRVIRPDLTPMPPEEYASVRALNEKRRVENVEMGIVQADGQVTWISVTAEPIPLQGYGVVVTYGDITQRKQAEEVSQRNQATLRGILDAAKESIWLFSSDGKILLGNATAVERFGELAREVVGKRFGEILPAELARTRLARLREVVESGRPLEFEDERSGIRFRHSFYPVLDQEGRVSSVACFSRDITEQKKADEALRASQERLKLAQQAGRIGTFDRNLRTGALVWSEEMEALFGLPPGSFAGSFNDWLESIHPDDRQRVQETIQQGVANRTNFQMEFRLCWPDGSLHWIEARGKVVCDEKGHALRTIGVNMDITERKRMQQALEAANQELQTTNTHLQSVTEELRVSNETLERRVSERTENLRQTNRILRMITECNQALVQLSNEQELIQRICRTIHETGGYRMVWVGFAENDQARTVRPIATVGLAKDYLQQAKITWADNQYSGGPTGRAIRSGKVCAANDFLSEADLLPWRELALTHGFRSSVALPLLAGGRAFGALTIYAAEPAAFAPDEIGLLAELAEDLSFGLSALRVQAERDRARKELEQKAAQLRALAEELVYTEQRERRRLAQILHDRLQQLLVGARYNLESLRTQSEEGSFQDAVRRVDGFLDECIKMSRSLTAELSPPVLYEAGLAAALRWLGRWFQETHGLAVHVTADDEPASDSEELRFTLFQAVRELLFNVVKHAKVRQAEVRLSRPAGGQVRIIVSDQGAGFEMAALQAREGKLGGFGLFSVRERLESLGGQLEIESAPGRGSRFVLSVTSETAAPQHPATEGEPSSAL